MKTQLMEFLKTGLIPLIIRISFKCLKPLVQLVEVQEI